MFYGTQYLVSTTDLSEMETSDTLDSLIHLILSQDQNYVPEYALTSQSSDQSDTIINPNTATLEGLLVIGMSDWAANNLLKYRDKGGTIRTPDDLKKIYGVDSTLYESIKGQLSIPDPSNYITNTTNTSRNIGQDTIHSPNNRIPRINSTLLDLNSASEEQLMGFRGIGPVLSQRIIKYRSILGGYYKKEQLKEVYGLPLETYESIANSIEIGSPVSKLDLLQSEFEILLRHPYLDYDMVKRIFSLRSDSVSINTIIHTLESEYFDVNRLIPYIKVSSDENKM